MSNEMVERVAAAIAVSCDGTDYYKKEFIGYARAAIEAMMEPNHDMTAPVVEPGEDRTNVVRIYTAMLQAALKEDE